MSSRFRTDFHACLTARADELFELTDALLCTDGPVKTLVDLALAPEHRRGHGALYDGVNHGGVDLARPRRTVAGLPLPCGADGRLMLAVDVSPWSRADASTSGQWLFCHTYGRKGQARLVPGWPYSLAAALELGRNSWTAMLDALRLGPQDDATAVTAGQLRDVGAGPGPKSAPRPARRTPARRRSRTARRTFAAASAETRSGRL